MVWACWTAPPAAEVAPKAAAGTMQVEDILPALPSTSPPPLRKVGMMERMELEREVDRAVADGMLRS